MIISFFTVWAIHGLGWFTISAFAAVIRGDAAALKITNAFALGSVSAILHGLVLYYLGG